MDMLNGCLTSSRRGNLLELATNHEHPSNPKSCQPQPPYRTPSASCHVCSSASAMIRSARAHVARKMSRKQEEYHCHPIYREHPTLRRFFTSPIWPLWLAKKDDMLMPTEGTTSHEISCEKLSMTQWPNCIETFRAQTFPGFLRACRES